MTHRLNNHERSASVVMTTLIDTNVILDALLGREPFYTSAQQIFILTAEEQIEGCITASSVTDIFYLLMRYLHDNTRCKQELSKLLTLFTVLDVNGTDCERALQSSMLDYEDALLSTCGKRAKVDCIITRNIKDFADSPVRAIAPDDFLKGFTS